MTGSILTLRDGYQIPLDLLAVTNFGFLGIIAAKQKGALFELVDKCNDATKKYQISAEAKKILREYRLMDENDHVPEHVKKVVFNSIKRTTHALHFRSPLMNRIPENKFCKL